MLIMSLNLTPEQWRLKAREEIGDVTRDHIFEVRLPLSTTSGVWGVLVNGSESDPIAYNASASQITDLVSDLDTVGIGNFSAEGVKKGPYGFRFTGDLGGMNMAGIVTTSSAIIPNSPVTIHTVQVGQSEGYVSEALMIWNGLGADTSEAYTITPPQLRYLAIKIEVGKKRLGSIMGRIDTKDRDYEEKRSQETAELRRVIADAQNDYNVLNSMLDSTGKNSAMTTKIARRTGSGLPFGTVATRNGLFRRD